MALPAIHKLSSQGFTPVLVGKPWVAALFSAYPWDCLTVLPSRVQTVQKLRQWRQKQALPSASLAPALLLTNSFSTALEFRLAGLAPVGFSRDGRGFLLKQAVAVPSAWSADMHTIDYYLHLVQRYLGDDAAMSALPVPHLDIHPAAMHAADEALEAAGIRQPFVVLCPVAQGLHHGQNKCWSGFGQLGQKLHDQGIAVVICPGPGEASAATAAVPTATVLGPLPVDAFAALLRRSALVVANDSGPGHLAAAVGARLLGIFGVTDPTKTCPRAPGVQICGHMGAWPDDASVWQSVQQRLTMG